MKTSNKAKKAKKASLGLRPIKLATRIATTAQLGALYPAGTPAGSGPAGVLIGEDQLSGSMFFYDPFAAYEAGRVTNPNMFVMGAPGTGKSTTIKVMLARAASILGRKLVIVDPKGEYGDLATQLGLEVIRLRPGGEQQVNPFTPPDTNGLQGEALVFANQVASSRVGVAAGMLTELLHRPLTPTERAALSEAIRAADNPTTDNAATGKHAGASIDEIIEVLRNPSEALAYAMDTTPALLAQETRDMRLAFGRLTHGDLAGMFNGAGNTTIDWDGPGVVLDLSAVVSDDVAVRLAMIATVGWLQAAMADPNGPQRLQVLDEAWRLLGSDEGVRYLQACWKLGRTFGVANVFITHTIADLSAQLSDAEAGAKIARTLLSDSATRVTLRQADDALADTEAALGLTDAEAAVVGRLARGVAFWQVGAQRTVVETLVGDGEKAMIDTDQRMRQ